MYVWLFLVAWRTCLLHKMYKNTHRVCHSAHTFHIIFTYYCILKIEWFIAVSLMENVFNLYRSIRDMTTSTEQFIYKDLRWLNVLVRSLYIDNCQKPRRSFMVWSFLIFILYDHFKFIFILRFVFWGNSYFSYFS